MVSLLRAVGLDCRQRSARQFSRNGTAGGVLPSDLAMDRDARRSRAQGRR